MARDLTWYDLTNSIKADFNEHLKYNDGEYDEDNIHEIVDGCVPIYTADVLTVAVSNLHLATGRDAHVDYADDATAIDIIQTNIYCELSDYLTSNAEDWQDEYNETNKTKKEEV